MCVLIFNILNNQNWSLLHFQSPDVCTQVISKLKPTDWFYKLSFIGTQPCSFIYILSMNAFTL